MRAPRLVVALMRMNTMIDISGILPYVRVPTLVVHRINDPVVNIEGGRQLANSIPNARFLELLGASIIFHSLVMTPIRSQTRSLNSSLARKPALGDERILATVLITDIVGSTKHAETTGDRRWRELLDAHNVIFRRELTRFRGTEVKTTGD